MSKKNQNPKHWNLCTIKEVAQFTGFTEQNIRDRYKKVEGKENLYNAFQVMTYLDKEKISQKEFLLVNELYLNTCLNNEMLKEMLNRRLSDL